MFVHVIEDLQHKLFVDVTAIAGFQIKIAKLLLK
jgi:hypothetical protein